MSKFGTWTEENIQEHQFDWEAMGKVHCVLLLYVQ
jgi:hypothetical protein